MIFGGMTNMNTEFRLQLRLIVAWEDHAGVGGCQECGRNMSN